MKLIKIVNTIPSIENLSRMKFYNWGASLKVSNLLKKMNSDKDFYISKEREIIESYVKKDENGNYSFSETGQPQFESVENATKFQQELFNLQTTEAEGYENPLVIFVKDFKFGEEALSPNDILVISDFVSIKDEEEDADKERIVS